MGNVVKMNQPQDEKVVMIDGWVIKQDANGLYCLNDVHKAAGARDKHKVPNWARSDEAQALVAELVSQKRDTKVLYVRKGYAVTGTYAVKELVYAYAMWISAEYHLKVIRAYDTLATEGVAVHEGAAEDVLANPLKYMKAIIAQAEAIEAERDALKALSEKQAAAALAAAPKVEFVDKFVVSEGTYTFREVCKMLEVKEKGFRQLLIDEGVMYKLNKTWVPYKKHIVAKHFEVKIYVDPYGCEFTNAWFTAKGVHFCAELVMQSGRRLAA